MLPSSLKIYRCPGLSAGIGNILHQHFGAVASLVVFVFKDAAWYSDCFRRLFLLVWYSISGLVEVMYV